MNSTILNLLNKTKINTDNQQEVKKYALGEVIANKYEVLDKLAISTSGEADIYRVKPLEDNRELVVKVFRRDNSSKNDVFEKIKNINNKNVGQILEYGEIDGFTYIVMPYYKNDSLEKLIANGVKLDKKTLKPILESIIDGLNAMHEAGIFHKDLKPANMMISDDGSHIILIDFGISSSTNGKTVVATQTGKTPFYSAPETYTNLFLKESDYYSLGITIYELITGTTPYQNTSIENLQQYQQIQQIPFSDDFDEDLKDLISALTYKDISYRNDKSNPNRRWCYDEVRKWLNGEKQPIPGSAQTSNVQTLNPSQIPYMFKGKKYFNLTELITNFLLNWDEGKKEVFRYNLSKYFELIEDKNKLEETDKAAKAIEEDDSLSDSIFFDLMYQLAPEIKQFYWQGYLFEGVYDYGDKLIKESLEQNADNVLLETSKNPIVLEKLKWFAHHVNDNSQAYAKIIDNLQTLLTSEPLEVKLNALRVGYALTNKESFKIGDTVFETINDFNSFLEDLYNSDLLKYRDFCIKNDSQIKEIAKLFSGDKKKQFEKNLISNKQTIEIGKIKKFYFRDYKEIARYVNKLWKNDRLEEFHFFTINCIEELRTVIEERNLQNIFNEYLSNINSYLCINEYIFKDIPEFKNYWEHLSKRQRKEFVDSHGNAIDEALSKRPVSDRNIIDSLLEQDLKTTHNLNDFKVGNIVTLGNFGGPIEWQVLEVKDNKALLLSKHILFMSQFDKGNSNSWTKSSLRKYLNGKFFENCFSRSEKKAILLSDLKLKKGYTEDRLFLLSVEEVNKYLKSVNKKIAVHLNVVGKNGDNWWLRSSDTSINRNNVDLVDRKGLVSGTFFNGLNGNSCCGVRVALQWNLDSLHCEVVDGVVANKTHCDKVVIESGQEQASLTTPNLNDFKVGNIVTLGNYESPIEWEVLEIKDNKAFLLSKHILFKRAFDKNGRGNWETSSLRKYLNGEFFENCFTEKEKKNIEPRELKVNGDLGYISSLFACLSGNSKHIEDRLYLLSIEEVCKYLNEQSQRIAVDLNEQSAWWWLRCHGSHDGSAACVRSDGFVLDCGYVADGGGGVRVALQWNLES